MASVQISLGEDALTLTATNESAFETLKSLANGQGTFVADKGVDGGVRGVWIPAQTVVVFNFDPGEMPEGFEVPDHGGVTINDGTAQG